MKTPTPPTGESRPREDDEFRHDRVKRRAYIVVVGLSCLSMLVLTAGDALTTPYWGVVYPVLAVLNVGLLVAIWRARLSIRTFELLLVVPVIGALLGFLLAWRIAPAAVDVEVSALVLSTVWIGMAFPMCYLVLGTRRGLQASAALYALTVVLIASGAAAGHFPGGSDGLPAQVLSNMAFFFGMLIALLWVLASRVESLAYARAEAAILRLQAHSDALTGLANRRRLDDELRRHLDLARRHDQPLSVLLVDVDRFKDVNDQLGHDMGDQALIELAKRLSRTVRTTDLVGRWGGEEFLLIAPHADADAALELAERCRDAVASMPFAGIGQLTVSVGVATQTPDDQPRALVARADLALYTAKNTGRNRVARLADLVPATDPRWATERTPNQ